METKGPHTFEFAEGIHLANPSGVHEAYSERQSARGFVHFVVNVSAPHIGSYFHKLIAKVRSPAFFLVEVGVNKDEEDALRKSDSDPYHKHVYYLDGIEPSKGAQVFACYERLLTHDGMVNFGFGSHNGWDEVYVGPYKLFEIYTDDPDKYRAILRSLGVPKEQELRTVWKTFTHDTPGSRSVLTEGKTIWDMLEEMKKLGFYKAETRSN